MLDFLDNASEQALLDVFASLHGLHGRGVERRRGVIRARIDKLLNSEGVVEYLTRSLRCCIELERFATLRELVDAFVLERHGRYRKAILKRLVIRICNVTKAAMLHKISQDVSPKNDLPENYDGRGSKLDQAVRAALRRNRTRDTVVIAGFDPQGKGSR